MLLALRFLSDGQDALVQWQCLGECAAAIMQYRQHIQLLGNGRVF